MKKFLIASFVVACGVAFATVPEVSNIVLEQGSDRVVRVSYDLTGGTAAITMDVLTNGVPIGRSYLVNAKGDVDTYVKPGVGRRITWNPLVGWPDSTARSISVRLVARAANEPPAYMAVDLVGENAGTIKFYGSVDELPGGIGSDVYRTTKLLMRRIPAANIPWKMGKAGASQEAVDARHRVALQKDFWLGVFEVTQEQYKNVMGEYKGYFTASRATRPVESVSYHEVRANTAAKQARFPQGQPYSTSFMGTLRNVAALDFDLPTEAQWEYACRAGTETGYYNGTEDAQPTSVIGLAGSASSPAATTEPADGGTKRVGSHDPNGFGLYDMYGNVSEWCVDCYNEVLYGQESLQGETIDPCNWNTPMTDSEDNDKNNTYVRRGGGWRDLAKFGTSSRRYYWANAVNSIGFRVMCYGLTEGAE